MPGEPTEDPLKRAALRELGELLSPQSLHVLARSAGFIKRWGFGNITIIFYKGDVADIYATPRMKPSASIQVPFDGELPL